MEKGMAQSICVELCSIKSAGVVVLINKNIQHKIKNSNLDNLRRRLSIDLEIDNKTYQILNIYGPNKPKSKESFFEKMKHYIKNLKNVITACNFNMVEELKDREGGNTNNSHLIGLKALPKLKNDHNLEDT